MKLEWTELYDIRVAINEKISRYEKIIEDLQKHDHQNKNYYKVAKNILDSHKRLYKKVDNIIKNYDNYKDL